MQKHCESNVDIIRSGTRIRESIRCLPKGHFQQIRQMFDKQSCSMKNLSTIHERQQKSKSLYPSHVLLKLPVTDDEKLQHTTTTTTTTTTNIDDIIIENEKSIEEQYQIFRTKLINKTIENCLSSSLKQDEQLLKLNSSLSNENHFHTDTISYTPSLSQQFISPIEREKSILTFDQRRQLAMASAINYADSYESSSTSTHLNRMGSTRQYVSNLQRTSAVHAKPVLVKTTCNILKHDPIITYDTNNNNNNNNNNKLFQSSTSLSSTGYDSNSSPSIISKRNSLITDRYNDHSLSSDEIFDSTSLISRSNTKLNHSPISLIRHPTIHNSSKLDSSLTSPKYIVQTTSFPDSTINDYNKTFSLKRKHKFDSIGFQIQQQSPIHTPIVVQKSINQREQSPLPIVENPLFQQLPPRKPPRTFEHENSNNYISKTIDQKLPSSSSSSTSDSPTFDLGARSISCMDLTVGVSSALLSSGLLPLDKNSIDIECKSNILFDNTKKFLPNENIYEELQIPLSTFDKKNNVQQYNKIQTMKRSSNDVTFHTPKTKINHSLIHTKSVMKKGISEPNLAKTKSSSSLTFFSPRALIDRFKRILPLSLSKQSLNDTNTMTIDSDDSISISSESNDHIRTSRLDHVSRVKNVYDSL
ncbi:unnamed protein product, partial [Rotaria sordida]